MSKEWKTLSKEIVDKLINEHLDKDKPTDECLMPNCHNKRRWLAKGGFSKFCSEQCSYNFRGFVKKLKCDYANMQNMKILKVLCSLNVKIRCATMMQNI